ncbi:unnamed protein product [Echinostoma caproni]|uniref:DUF4278 domain-containing protein n=1 Tax=Echinostoma caproni TaxID=27848 RepID=A0A183BBF5_9TREM|nr:unnamed protein product [Echinostoma caproni]
MGAFRLLYASHVRPRLQNGSVTTYPYTAGELAKSERVQRAATRPVVGLRGTSYEGRLHATGLFPVCASASQERSHQFEEAPES